MPLCRVQKILSPIHRSTLAAKIKRLRLIAMISCTPCARARTLCVFSRDSSKCSKCIHKGVFYNGNFSEADFDKLLEEKDHLEAARTYTITEAASLDKRIKALWKA
jgi:Zn ribbon nucleic-acid-binding protein